MRGVSTALLAAFSTFLTIGVAAAQEDGVSHDMPHDGGIALRDAATPMAQEIHIFHDFVLLPIMVGISLLVLGLLIWVVIRYNSKSNPVPSKFSHNTTIEVIWTLFPVLILLFIALFSFDLLYIEDKMPDAQVQLYEEGTTAAAFPNDFVDSRKVNSQSHLEVMLVDQSTGDETLLTADDYTVQGYGQDELRIDLAQAVPQGSLLKVIGGRSRIGQRPFLGLFGEDKSQIIPAPSITIKATGFQWGWTYSYPDFGDFEFDALIKPRDQVPSELYKLAATNDVVVPAGETVRIVTTARDVIHSWAMPAFGTKIDAIPGRLNETWFYTEQEGMYYGQCSEICGIDHAFMPISVRVVSRPEFEAWVNEQADLNGLEPFFSNEDQLAAVTPATTLN